MGDFASVIGGGPVVGLDDIAPDLDAYYRIVSDNISLDLSDHTGTSTVDASGNDAPVEVDLGSASDTLFGGNGDDSATGGAGSDSLAGAGGDDELAGGKGYDTLQGEAGDDTLAGERGYDDLSGGQGDDYLAGGQGYDSLSGGDGDDLLFGGAGGDTLVGGAGDDALVGGSGADAFLFSSGFGDDTIADFTGGKDEIWLTANLNGSGIGKAADVAQFVTGDASATTITIGEDSIRLEGVGKDDFLQHLTAWVKVV